MINSFRYSKVYLIDDFEIMNLLHKKLFQKLGLKADLRLCTNTEEALEYLRSDMGTTSTALILLDINIPQLDGFQFLDILKRQFASIDIDVVIVSSTIWETNKQKTRLYPEMVISFVTKPMNQETFNALFKRLSYDTH